ncbi:MAG: outer membrane lipoprotein carrier protein LolA [Bacteroidales bacterium]|nr:outer membrane lipoprotein carrier protein LolA [Bacteroidales bacterium]
MKNTILLFIAGVLSASVCAQQDPEAKKILDRVSEKTKAYTSIIADFELIINNRRDDMVTNSKGIIKVKGDKYYLESMDSEVYFDGKTMWTYMEDINEVTISEPDTSEGDFIENPVKIFDFYNRDFKYHLVGEAKVDGIWMYEIDLFPKNLNQPYSRFKIFVDKETEHLYMISAIAKDGVDYTAYIRNAKYNQNIDDSLFIFDPNRHDGIEIVDMRF